MPAPNDITARDDHWTRHPGDDWACYDALPPVVRARIQAHAYDAWTVNALRLWRALRRERGADRAERALLRHLDRCEREERDLFAEDYRRRTGHALPHLAAAATVLRAAVRNSPASPARR